MRASLRIALFALVITLALVACSAPTPNPTSTPLPVTATPFPSPTAIPATATAIPAAPSAVPTMPTSVLATPTTVPAASQPLAGDAEITSKFEKLFSTLRKSGTFSGIVFVAHNGKVLYEKDFGKTAQEPIAPITSSTKFRIASDTKQFTATAILKLQAQGKLKVEDTICKYLQSCPKGWEKITLHHLLTHTSGIDQQGLNDADKPHTPAELVAQIEKLPLKFEPGEQFSYSNNGYIVLAALIEQLSGKTYEAFLRESFFEPLKMNDTGVVIDDSLLAGYGLPIDISNLIGSGDVYSTIEDLYRWTQALDAWQRDPRSEYQQMFQPQVPSDIPGWKYGYGLDVANQNGHLYVGHPGGLSKTYGSLVARYPDDGLTIIELSNNGYVLDQDVMAKMVFGAK